MTTNTNEIDLLIAKYNIHVIVDGMFYYTDDYTGQTVSLKRSAMKIKFKALNKKKAIDSLIEKLQDNNRVWDTVYSGKNPPPNALVIPDAGQNPELNEFVFDKLFTGWGLGHIVTKEAFKYYKSVGGNSFKNEIGFGIAIAKYISENAINGWVHKRSGFQIGREKHLVGWININASKEDHDITIMADRTNRHWGIVHRITSLPIVKKLSLDLIL